MNSIDILKTGILIILLIVVIYMVKTNSGEHFAGVQNNESPSAPYFDKDVGSSLGLPGTACGQPGNADTTHQRPDVSFLRNEISADVTSNPLYVKLFYNECSKAHPLYTLFDNLAREYPAQAVNKDVVFKRILVNNDAEGLPRIFKYGYNGNVIEYKGAPNYGALSDWVLNFNLLF